MMTVNTNAILTTNLSVHDIVDILRSEYPGVTEDTPVSLSGTGHSDTAWIRIQDQVTGDRRSIHVGLNNVFASDYAEVFKGPSMFLSLGCSGDAVGIFRSILDVTGGFIRQDDVGGEWEAITASKPHPLVSFDNRVDGEVGRLVQAIESRVDMSLLPANEADFNRNAIRHALRGLVSDIFIARDAKLSEGLDEGVAGPTPR